MLPELFLMWPFTPFPTPYLYFKLFWRVLRTPRSSLNYSDYALRTSTKACGSCAYTSKNGSPKVKDRSWVSFLKQFFSIFQVGRVVSSTSTPCEMDGVNEDINHCVEERLIFEPWKKLRTDLDWYTENEEVERLIELEALDWYWWIRRKFFGGKWDLDSGEFCRRWSSGRWRLRVKLVHVRWN